MSFFFSYLKQRKVGIAVFLLFCAIFLCAFALYHLPAGAVLYPAFVCSFIGILILALDFWRVCRKHRELLALQELSAELINSLPEASTIEEEDYRQLIRGLQEDYRQLENRMNRRYSDMVDYYTVWVHQIKTPIASMRLSIQNEDSCFSARISDDLFRIEQYVEMVLCYLRLDSESTDYVIQECGLDRIVRQVLKKFAGQFYRRGLKLDYKLSDKAVLTDEKWLSFVVEQVLSNALKYTPSGTITIDMEIPNTLCIRDTGIGIAPEDLPRIFERGYTGYNGRSDKRASGLGLYLCKRICNNLGHTITVNSFPESGTVVRINLDHKKLEIE